MAENLALSVRRYRTLAKAWQAVHRNGRLSKSAETRNEIKQFSEDAPRHLKRIQAQLRKGRFVFPPAKGVKAKKKGKTGFRPLVIAPVESRIVQRAIHDVLLEVPEIEMMVRTPNSFGGVKKHDNEDLSSVPAAIQAVLDSIGDGAAYFIRSDISKFFTRIPKSGVREIISGVITDSDFLDLFDKAVAAELSNLEELQSDSSAFPIEDIGVAQGNSLSPLLGNLLLRDFDEDMNARPGIRCIRYIDDFIVLGPDKQSTESAFEKAKSLLNKWQMELAIEKTDRGTLQHRFEFLGIEFNNGFLRPSASSRKRFLDSVRSLLQDAQEALIRYKNEGRIERKSALLKTLVTLSDTLHGWGIHYSFCNDAQCLRKLDDEVSSLLQKYFGTYRSVRNSKGSSSTWELLGIQSLEKIERKSFVWPKRRIKSPI